MFSKPQIPSALMHTLYAIEPGVERSNGRYKPTDNKSETPFKGVVMPVSDKDLQYLPEGTVTVHSQKIYTNGEILLVGQQIKDPQSGKTYTVKSELDHNSIHPMNRYLVECLGGASNR